MLNKLTQNDFPEWDWMVNTGCLLHSLRDIVEEESQHIFSHKEFTIITEVLLDMQVISDESNKNKKGAFVWNHEIVLNTMLEFVGVTNRKFEYSGRVYMPYYTSWKPERYTNKGTHRKADYVIHQIYTSDGISHFRRPKYDPWKYGTTELHIKSERFYKVTM